MRILIGFECSGAVRDAFIARGHLAWSCDLKPAETDNHRHLQDDFGAVLEHRDWDLIILHPPCQHMAVSGNSTWANSVERDQAVKRTMGWWDLACKAAPRVALENPVGVLSSQWCKPCQYIQPYHFGDDASKRTGLWLHGLPKLRPTALVQGKWHCCGMPLELDDKYSCPNCEGINTAKRIWANQTPSGQNKLGPSPTRAADRARTYAGIAAAMANQWG